MNANELLNERQTTHGEFTLNAIYAQDLRSLFRSASGWSAMHPVQREALDMIATKLSRVLSGQSRFADHWADVEGYARLARGVCD